MSIDQILSYETPSSAKKRKLESIDEDNETGKNSKAMEVARKRRKTDENFKKRLENLISNPIRLKKTFKSIGVCRELCIATKKMKWSEPTKIQIECIPHILLGKDVIALAETGSGKTGSFAIPIIQNLLSSPCSYHSLVISPTRELALQIHEQFEELGCDIGLKSITIIGGVDRIQQAIQLQKKPHAIIGTPGRILDHLITCKGFKLHHLKFLVLDEADRILQSEFASAIEQIIKFIQKQKSEFHAKVDAQKQTNAEASNTDHPHGAHHDYQTLLFSATMTKKVQRLEKASLRTSNMIKIEVNSKYKTVSTLSQYYLFIPAKHKLLYVVYLLNNMFNDRSIIVFTNTKKSCHHLSLVLHNLNQTVIPLHGEMTQYERMGAIEKFKEGAKSILVATDVAARGLDIPIVSIIINYDIPIHSKDYIHRVGRTARAGKKGQAINLVTQYDVEIFQRIEQLINLKMSKYPNIEKGSVMQLIERVLKADHVASMQIKEHKDEIKLKIKELSQRKKTRKGAPRLQVKDGDGDDEDDDQFVIDDVDYDEDGGEDRMLGPKQKRTNFEMRENVKWDAKKNMIKVSVVDEDEGEEEAEGEGEDEVGEERKALTSSVVDEADEVEGEEEEEGEDEVGEERKALTL
eukprot:CAMPEP_0197075740 /NCGR_PEP_ID=MMETSP1384-20130603/211763_1 /TAXON_ID=29189 /ORGANISM="Ammonia sp." /LENGTH=633 /DNA_ID=CAMNT_0042514589 /DNA_START=27 /DNA_END=1930 /DNA_ORIENTATION=+